jgi:hypothetical protein
MTRRDSVLAAMLCLLAVAYPAMAATSTVILSVDGMT